MENYLNLKYFQFILDVKVKKEYEFNVKVYFVNNDYYVMIVILLYVFRVIVDNFEIVYDFVKKLIIEFIIVIVLENIVEMEENIKVGFKNIIRFIVKVNYRVDGLDYYLLSLNEEIGYDIILKDKIKKNIQV